MVILSKKIISIKIVTKCDVVEVLLNEGKEYIEQGDLQKALTAFDRAIRDSLGVCAEAYFEKGKVLLALGDRSGAHTQYVSLCMLNEEDLAAQLFDLL